MSWVTIIWAMIASAAVAEGIPNPWMLIGQLPFSPDDRTKKILTEAVALANATSGSLFMNPREADWYYYPARPGLIRSLSARWAGGSLHPDVSPSVQVVIMSKQC